MPNKIPLLSPVVQGWKLAAEGYKDDRPNYRKNQQKKIAFHALLSPLFARRWFKLLTSKDYSYILSYRPRIYIKPFRVYISTRWNKKQKQKVILDSYRFIQSKGKRFEQVLKSYEGIIVAQLMLDESTEAILRFGYDDRFRKEGEFVLSLESQKLGGKLIATAFSVEETSDGVWTCRVGCVQGYMYGEMQDNFKVVQKLLHGLRPNSFIVFALQELARNLGTEKIYCVGSQIQAFRKKHAIHLPGLHDINFDYSQFWQECGGLDLGNDWFELPLIPERKSMEEIKSKKRSMYSKRYQLLDSISEMISTSVGKS
ncbi:MAG: DUF535 family protein [Bacteroidales bacterium]|nr:DUF535 family protein [Bacteroidales bacterium]